MPLGPRSSPAAAQDRPLQDGQVSLRFPSSETDQSDVSDPVFIMALWISGLILHFKVIFCEHAPRVAIFMLGISLSLSVSGLLLPSTRPQVEEYGLLLDKVFNRTVSHFMDSYRLGCPIAGVDLSWQLWLMSWWTATPDPDLECLPVALCSPLVDDLARVILPSTMASHISTDIQVLSLRLRLEKQASSVGSWFATAFWSCYSRMIKFAGDHAIVLSAIYMGFPGKKLFSFLKLCVTVVRPSRS